MVTSSISTTFLRELEENLAAAGADVAAGLREDVLTGFAKAHHAKEFPQQVSVYKGKGTLPELRLGYEYSINKPGEFDVTPLAGFADRYKRWILTLPEVLAFRRRAGFRDTLDAPPPNVRIRLPEIELKVTMLPSGSSLTLKYKLTVLGFVAITGGNLLEITPIDAFVEDVAKLNRDIDAAIRKAGLDPGNRDDTCYELKELVRHIINSVLSMRIASFIQKLPLPTPVKLFDGFEVSSLGLEIREDFIVISGTATAARQATLMLQDEQFNLDTEALNEEIRRLETSAKRVQKELGKALELDLVSAKDSNAAVPGKGVFLFFSQKLFQILANKYVVFEAQRGNCGMWGPFEGCWAVSQKVSNPRVAISGSRVHVDIDGAFSYSVKARVHTHCGPLPWVGPIGVGGRAEPARLDTGLFLKNNNRELWMSAGIRPFDIRWDAIGIPWPISMIFELLFAAIFAWVEWFLLIIGDFWTKKLASFPATFPGTNMPYQLRNTQVTNFEGNIALLCDISF